jgi:hypothetical protein
MVKQFNQIPSANKISQSSFNTTQGTEVSSVPVMARNLIGCEEIIRKYLLEKEKVVIKFTDFGHKKRQKNK